ncbi:hypothetical protein NPA31_000225 [Aurantimonas sp. MSK8Z-1]|uniref:hypothetical protein n=1 Tax=Mangrovibrevibacter kandeliae TaxID=2968473 RepID=UPI0021175987|nr:hypothetical protein [Aurantimonas sp. MSK8Z-1]MCW4113383.1 hypothetical protein [Aurantimonas sp. MSK8Z-1]
MSPRQIVLEVIAVLSGAILALLVTALIAWIFAGSDFFAIAASIGRLLTALVTVALFAVLYAYLPPTPAALASFFIGILLPAVLARYAFDDGTGWAGVLIEHIVFSLVALLTYRWVHAKGTARTLAAEVADRL